MIKSKIILCLIMTAVAVGNNLYSFSLSSLTPIAFAGRIHRKTFGVEDASPYYQEKIHEFLSYLEVKNPDNVKVRKLELSTEVLQANVSSSGFIGIALWTGIWVNEPKLEKMADEEKLWTLALMAAQYKLNISLKHAIAIQILPWGPGFVNVAGILLALPVINLCKTSLGKSLLAAVVGLIGARVSLMLYSSFIQRWYAHYKRSEHEANLMAAKLLCDHGYFAACEKHVQNLVASSKEHSAVNESAEKLTEFLNAWVDKHAECNQYPN